MASIRFRGKKYRVQIRLKGFSPKSACFDDEETARLWAAEQESQMKLSRQFGSRHLFIDLLIKYIDEYLSHKKDYHRRVCQLNFWKEKFKKKFVDEITKENIEDVIKELNEKISFKTKKTFSKATVERYLAALSHFFTVVVREWGLLRIHPVQLVKTSTGKNPRIGNSPSNATYIHWVPFSIRSPVDDTEVLILFDDATIASCFWSPFNQDDDGNILCEDHNGSLIDHKPIFWSTIPEIPEYEYSN